VATRDSGAKNPRHVAAGVTGARTRWGPPRILRLDQLDPVTAEIVRAVLTARENATKAAERASGQG
jgi:hypothetical protein